jgi:hypothetical protein
MGMPEHPSVPMSSSIVHAVELMLKNDVSMIAVAGPGRLVGHIMLSDALKHLGLRMARSSSAGEEEK